MSETTTTERTDPPWEPPIAGTEIEHLIGALDRQRYTFRWKVAGLDAQALNATFGAESLTLAGLLKHLALVERHKFNLLLAGVSPGEPFEAVDWDADPDWEFRSSAGDTPEYLFSLYDDAVLGSRQRLSEALATDGLDRELGLEWRFSLRRMLFDLVEEYSRHTGHADLLRENIDGLVGEDPPGDFRVGAWEVAA